MRRWQHPVCIASGSIEQPNKQLKSNQIDQRCRWLLLRVTERDRWQRIEERNLHGHCQWMAILYNAHALCCCRCCFVWFFFHRLCSAHKNQSKPFQCSCSTVTSLNNNNKNSSSTHTRKINSPSAIFIRQTIFPFILLQFYYFYLHSLRNVESERASERTNQAEVTRWRNRDGESEGRALINSHTHYHVFPSNLKYLSLKCIAHSIYLSLVVSCSARPFPVLRQIHWLALQLHTMIHTFARTVFFTAAAAAIAAAFAACCCFRSFAALTPRVCVCVFSFCIQNEYNIRVIRIGVDYIFSLIRSDYGCKALGPKYTHNA